MLSIILKNESWYFLQYITAHIYFENRNAHQSLRTLFASRSADMLEMIESCLRTQCVNALSHVLVFVTPWTVAHQDSLPVEFFWQEYWGGLPFPSSRDLPDLGIKLTSPRSPALQADSLPPSHYCDSLRRLTTTQTFSYLMSTCYVPVPVQNSGDTK